MSYGVAYCETISAKLHSVGPAILRVTSEASSRSKLTSNTPGSASSTASTCLTAKVVIAPVLQPTKVISVTLCLIPNLARIRSMQLNKWFTQVAMLRVMRWLHNLLPHRYVLGCFRSSVRLFGHMAACHQHRNNHRHLLDGVLDSKHPKSGRSSYPSQARRGLFLRKLLCLDEIIPSVPRVHMSSTQSGSLALIRLGCFFFPAQ
jgi:hypothetical protein